MNNYFPTIICCAPMMISFSYLIKKTYHENIMKREILTKYNKFDDSNYNPFKNDSLMINVHNLDMLSKIKGP